MSEPILHYLRGITPALVLKWTGVLFIVALEILVITALILSMAGVFD